MANSENVFDDSAALTCFLITVIAGVGANITTVLDDMTNALSGKFNSVSEIEQEIIDNNENKSNKEILPDESNFKNMEKNAKIMFITATIIVIFICLVIYSLSS